jgi:hypothetical protein
MGKCVEEKDRYKQDTLLKKWWSWFVGIFISVWSVFAAVIFILKGSMTLCLSDYVVITLITTTLANILGLSFLVVKHLFSSTR